MDPDPEVASGEATENTPEVESPEVTAPEVVEGAEKAPETPKAEEKSPELVKLERELRKAQRINARLHQQVTAPRPNEGSTEQTQGSDDPRVLAQEIARIQRFTEKSNELVSRGTAKHNDYMESLRDLASEVGQFVLPNGAPSKFMEVVQEVSDDPAELLYHLSKNDELAEGLADLTPIQLAKKLARIESAMVESSKPQVSRAPKPLEPIRPKAPASNEPSDNDSVDDWLRKERARLSKRQG
jgi:hypothetical protein